MSLVALAQETVAISERGWYELPSGGRVEIGEAVARAVAGTRLYRPGEYDALDPPGPGPAASVHVTGETTGAAARRLVEEGVPRVAALNFASARNPGGGFLRGAKAQEEDLARCSALYACQITQRAYYDENRAHPSVLYTDHLIYSPDVPFFRDEKLDLLPAPFLVSILTSPAPNAGEARRHGESAEAIHAALVRRAEQVLLVAAHHGHRALVLGAWGCGVFANDPVEVAGVFADHLAAPRFARAFTRVVFAVYDRSNGQDNRRAFEARFGRAAG